MNLIELLQDKMSPDVLAQLANQIGAQDTRQVEAASTGIFSTLLAAMNKNANSQMGLNSLVSALDRDHDGSILDNLAGFFTGNAPTPNTATTNGSGILAHILGGLQPNVVDMIGRMSGLDKSKVGQLAAMLAPMVLGMLGKKRQESGINVAGVGDLLKKSVQTPNQPQMGLLAKFLDRNGDGSVIDDIARMGMQAFLKK